MRRRQLVELEDLAWFPPAVRDGGTDWLAFMANHTNMFGAAAPHIRRAMQATSTTEVLDLCSGGGGPWLTLEPTLRRSGPVCVKLSDLYPNVSAWRELSARVDGGLRFRREPVDATNVPATARPCESDPVNMSCVFGVSPEPLTVPPFSVRALALVI